jgi:hypothetical protein
MKKMIKLLAALLLSALPALGQTTAVTATITDSDTQTWNNGAVTVKFVPNPNFSGQYQYQGAPYVPQTYTASMNGSGTFSLTVPDSTFIAPAGTQWMFIICPNSSAPCSSVTLPVSGASVNLSTFFSANVKAPRFAATGTGVYGYRDAEVNVTPVPGGNYYSVTQLCERIWNGASWSCGSGSGNVTAGAQYLIPMYSAAGVSAVLGPSNISTDATLNDLFVPGNLAVAGPRPYYDVTAPQFGATGSAQFTTATCNGTTSVTLASAIDFANGNGIRIFGCGPNSTLSSPGTPTATQITNMPQIDWAASPVWAQGATCSGTTATITTIGWTGLATGESVTVSNVESSSGSVLSQYNITATVTVTGNNTFTYTIGSCPGNGGSFSAGSLATFVLNSGSHTYSYEIAAVDANNSITAVGSPGSVTSANTVWPGFQVYNKVTVAQVTGATEYAVYRKIDAGSYACIGPASQPGQTTGSPLVTYLDFGVTQTCPAGAPSTLPLSVVPGMLVSSIVSGGGTASLVLANAASQSASGQSVVHDDTAAINAAYAAAASQSQNFCGGGIVNIPSPGQYNVGTLVFPTTTPNANCGMEVHLGGELVPYQPIIIQDRQNIHIVGNVGGQLASGEYTPAAFINPFFAPSPVLAIRGSNAIHLENIKIGECPNDCILTDTNNAGGPFDLKFENVNLTTQQGAPGFAFHCTNYLTSGATGIPFNFTFVGGAYAENNGEGKPSMLFDDGCGSSVEFKDNVTINGGGMYFRPSITLTGTRLSGGVQEAIVTPLFTQDSVLGGGFEGITIDYVLNSDIPTGADQALIKGINLGSGSILGLVVTNPDGSAILEGKATNFYIRCSFAAPSDCTGLAAPWVNWYSQSSGIYIDNSGQTYVFSAPSGSSVALHLVCNGSTGNPFQVENPAGTTVAALGCSGLVTPGTVLVANLPSAAANPNAIIGVSDSTAISAEGQTCVGSSTNKAFAFSNGSTWKCF